MKFELSNLAFKFDKDLSPLGKDNDETKVFCLNLDEKAKVKAIEVGTAPTSAEGDKNKTKKEKFYENRIVQVFGSLIIVGVLITSLYLIFGGSKSQTQEATTINQEQAGSVDNSSQDEQSGGAASDN